MWFWVGLLLIFAWGGWGYARRRWWVREIERSMASGRQLVDTVQSGHYAPPAHLALLDRIVTAVAGAAAIIGAFLVIGSYWGWFATTTTA
jgi:hypothetical protein